MVVDNRCNILEIIIGFDSVNLAIAGVKIKLIFLSFSSIAAVFSHHILNFEFPSFPVLILI